MTDLVWKDPEPVIGRGQKTAWDDIARQLKSRAGEWAVVANKNSPGSLTGAKENLRRRGTFDVTTRKNDDGGYDVYARFVSEPS